MDEENTSVEAEPEKEEKSISSDLIRGHINTIILRSLYDGDKYGYEIIAEIERKSHGQYSLKQPSLYSALKRLEKDGYVTSYWGGSVAGGRRKYFSLTDEGKEISEQNQSEWEYSRTVIDSLISDKDFDFNNPAPTSVNMRVLRSSTSRVPTREGEDDELDYEPTFDDSLDVSRLNAEFEEKNTALELERRSFEEEKIRFEEEIKARNAAILSERDWREQELAERERVLSEERQRIEALRNEQILGAAAEEAAKVATRAAEDAEIDERRRILEEEETARKAALEEEETERRRLLDEEEASRKSALAAEEAERRRLLEAEEAERRRMLDEEELARKNALEAEEAERRRILQDEELRKREMEAANTEHLRIREQQLAEQEAFYNEERGRFAELLRQRDEQLEAERRAHTVALVEQEQRILREQEILFRQREQQLLHQNYLDLVSTPPTAAPDPKDYNYYTAPVAQEQAPAAVEPSPAPAPASEREYRTVVQRIYAGTVENREKPEAPARARSLDGIDFRDLETRAAHDGIRITTTGSGKTLKKDIEESETLVHRGKALFLSALVVFCLCLIEAGITYAVSEQYGLPLFHPIFIGLAGLALLLVTGVAYANGYGKRAIRRRVPIMVNAVVAYALCVIITLIVALAVKIDFASTSALATFIVVPIVFFFGIIVFGICYYLLTRPERKNR